MAALGIQGTARVGERFDPSEWLLDRHINAGAAGKIAVRTGGRSLSYQELHDLTVRTTAGLRDLGLQAGERVLLVLLDSSEFIASFLGAIRAGAVAVPVNPLLSARDLAAIANDAHARIAIVSSGRSAPVEELATQAPRLEYIVITGDERGGASGIAADMVTWRQLTSTTASRTQTDVAGSGGYWLCTSGSTGRPKLAMHRPLDLHVAWETFGREILGIQADDVVYSVAPIFHAYGLGNSLVFPLAAGATTVLEAERPPTPARIARVLAEERPTVFFSVPTSYAALVASELPTHAFASVRLAVSAGESLPSALFEQLRERFGVEVIDAIGSTEMGHGYISNRPGCCIPDSCGVAVPGFEIRLVDDDGQEVGPETPARLWVRGPSAAIGYWQQPKESAETFVDGWVRTGDTFERSKSGDYRYLGRTDELFKVGGEWVSPTEVEAVIMEHPSVQVVAVVPGRMPSGVLQPVAFVVLRANAAADVDALNDHCRTRLAGFKRPKQWRFVDEVPKTAAGKIRRNVLREQLLAEAGDAH